MAFVVRAAREYRSFPSIDDYAYIPLAWAAGDPTLYPGDEILQGFVYHLPFWGVLVGMLESTVGLANGFWAFTLLLSIATVAAVYRLTRALEGTGLLFPLLVLLVFCGRVSGIGRGLYDGALGDAFHQQWLALCLLLFAYDAFVRHRAVVAGVLLGACAATHPVVGAHGAFVIAVATLFAPPGRWRRLCITAIACLVISAPVVVPLALGLFHTGADPTWTARQVIEDAYIYRAPHEFALAGTTAMAALLMTGVVVAGLGGAALLARPRPAAALGSMLGLWLGHGLLVAAAVLLHGPFLSGDWKYASLLPYLLSLTRTSPLLLVLSFVLLVAAVEVAIAKEPPRDRSGRVLLVSLCFALGTLVLLFVGWQPILVAAAALGVVMVLAQKREVALRGLLGAFAVLGLVGLGLAVSRDVREAPVTAEEAELFAWTRENTPREALFVVPPGGQAFRFYARRGVYVDFKLFPASTPAVVPEWRRRLDRVALPDRTALDVKGWPAVPHWDRSYANRNTPARIAGLLGETGADFLVWDAKGLEVPPFVPVSRPPDDRLERVFANPRFEVYRLAEARRDG
jgi:hypothetical protein